MESFSGNSGALRLGRLARNWAVLGCSALLGAWVLVACQSGPETSPTAGVERGQQVYTQYCQACHPGGNAGAGPAIRPAMGGLTDDELVAVIRHGKNRMPGFGEKQISNEDMDLMVQYMRGW